MEIEGEKNEYIYRPRDFPSAVISKKQFAIISKSGSHRIFFQI
jgi:hypothetical protein